MKTLVVISDSHGNIDGIKNLDKLFEQCDYIFHLGDYCIDCNYIKSKYEDKLYSVKGNCDFGGSPIYVQIEDVKVMAIHGNKYGVKSSLLPLMLKAKEEGCGLVLFGHTHNAFTSTDNGITMVNPGALSKRNGSYSVITIDKATITVQNKI